MQGQRLDTELEMDTDFESFSFEVRQNYFFDMFDLQYFFQGEVDVGLPHPLQD